jgi:recombining binding protein suppressor of hairless
LPLDVYLGSIGPLRLRAYQTSPPGPLTTVSPHVQSLPALPAGPSGGTQSDHPIPSPLHPTERRYVGEYLHTVVVVELPSMSEIVDSLQDEQIEQSSQSHSPTQKPSRRPPVTSRTLPLLFIRSSDGVGYHSGRTVTCEHAFQGVDLTSIGTRPPNVDPGWLAAAQAAAAGVNGGNLHGWTLRVM